MKKQSKKVRVAPQKPLTKAQQALVEKHISLAKNIGKKYSGLGRHVGVPTEDLQQEACFGLCVAAQNWNPSPSLSGGADTAAAFRTYAYNWCKKFIMIAIKNEPLDVFEDKDLEDLDIIDDDDEQTSCKKREQKVAAMLAELSSQEKKVVCMIYGIGTNIHTFKDIAQEMNLRTARVHQIYDCAMGKMEFSPSLAMRFAIRLTKT